MKKLIGCIFVFLFPAWQKTLEKEIKGLSVLDLGCGGYIPSSRFQETKEATGVDIYQPVLEEARKKKVYDKYILGDITKKNFPSGSYDAVVATGLLEHLNKEDGLRLLEQMKHWCRKKVLVTMPNGWLWQDAIGGNPYQVHQSAYTAKELRGFGYKVYGIYGLKLLRGYCARIKWKPEFFWAVISGITQYLCKYNPRIAHSLMAVYYKKQVERGRGLRQNEIHRAD